MRCFKLVWQSAFLFTICIVPSNADEVINLRLIQNDLTAASTEITIYDRNDSGALDRTEWQRLTWKDEVPRFDIDGNSEISHVGYWIGRQFWGRGIATAALKQLLTEVESRPLHARVALTNIASIRVLEKCGFRETGRLIACNEIILELTA